MSNKIKVALPVITGENNKQIHLPKSRGRQLTVRTFRKAYGNLLFCKLPLKETHTWWGQNMVLAYMGGGCSSARCGLPPIKLLEVMEFPEILKTVQPATTALSCLSKLDSKALLPNASHGLEKLSWCCPGSILFAGQFSQYQKLYEL